MYTGFFALIYLPYRTEQEPPLSIVHSMSYYKLWRADDHTSGRGQVGERLLCGRIRIMIGRKYLQPALVDEISTVGDGKKMKRGGRALQEPNDQARRCCQQQQQ